jgi:hypothetical protein
LCQSCLHSPGDRSRHDWRHTWRHPGTYNMAVTVTCEKLPCSGHGIKVLQNPEVHYHHHKWPPLDCVLWTKSSPHS